MSAVSVSARRDPPVRPPHSPRAVDLCGVRIHALTEHECVEHILCSLDAGRGGWVVTPNLDILRRCVKEPRFAAMVAEADLVVADGMPLVWSSRLQGTPLPERVAGSNLVSSLGEAAAGRGRSVFLLGGAVGAAEAAASVLRSRFPAIRIAGAHCPPLGFESDAQEIGAIERALLAARPDVIYVALGSPKQERLIRSLRALLPSAWWLGVGISLSFLCGDVRRAPAWMQRIGLEWLHRFSQEPGRLARRYFVDGAPFALWLFAASLRRRFSGAGDQEHTGGAP